MYDESKIYNHIGMNCALCTIDIYCFNFYKNMNKTSYLILHLFKKQQYMT